MTDRSFPVIHRSDELVARARRVIPGATQTLAKGPSQHVRVAPKFARRGRGATLIDADGNEFVDFQMAIGPLSLGYAYPQVDEAIRRQLEDGIAFSLVHPLEVEVAEMVSSLVPGAEMVRFSKTGADATSAAIRVARAFTGRERIVCCGYHGWHDWYIGVTPRDRGVPCGAKELVHTFAYNDLRSLAEAVDSETAAVILEPVTFDPPRPGFLEGVQAITARAGALLVFDEMWTGFRYALGGAQERFGIRSDLAVFSKAIANGMPISVVAGRRDVMQLFEDDVFFYTTFGGETLSLAAAKATMEILRDEDVPGHLERLGSELQRRFAELCEKLGIAYLRCAGLPPRTTIAISEDRVPAPIVKSVIQQELVRRGILWGGFHNLSFSHSTADLERLLDAYAEILPMIDRRLADGSLREALIGDPLAPVFRKATGFHSRPKAPPSAEAR